MPYAASSPTRKDFAAERAISSGDLLSSLPSPSLSALFSSWQQQQQRVCACVCVREGASVLPLRASRPRSTLVVLGGGGVGVAVVVVAVISYEEDGELSWSCRVASTSIVPTTNETDTHALSHTHTHTQISPATFMAPLSLVSGGVRGSAVTLLSISLVVVLLITAASSSSSSSSSESEIDRISRLNDWARDHLTSSHHLHIASSRRVVAANDIKVPTYPPITSIHRIPILTTWHRRMRRYYSSASNTGSTMRTSPSRAIETASWRRWRPTSSARVAMAMPRSSLPPPSWPSSCCSRRSIPTHSGEPTSVCRAVLACLLACLLAVDANAVLVPPNGKSWRVSYASRVRVCQDALPQRIGLPLSYSAADFELLRGSPVYGTRTHTHSLSYQCTTLVSNERANRPTHPSDNTIKSKRTLAAQWTLVHPILQQVSKHEFTADDWTWAMSVVISRAFAHRSGWTLVPVADMLDHHHDPSVSYSITNDGLALVASRDIAENEQVFGSYGKGSNAHFLQQFGFAVPNNDADTFTLSVSTTRCPFERFFINQAKLSQADLEDMVDEFSSGAGGYDGCESRWHLSITWVSNISTLVMTYVEPCRLC